MRDLIDPDVAEVTGPEETVQTRFDQRSNSENSGEIDGDAWRDQADGFYTMEAHS